ncbi:hypothetical protein CALCODRAFT_521381 [Calocera cornea HHB12733]|uniref:Uncharacterized protein n=1 Tax=Calocera cornea HHB12733 TaxID=1353952 RepID=A0A165CUU0_9BASI|nr:hypothetical protein CALCODRAFT_521381 [Calocera cornea HHB12733]
MSPRYDNLTPALIHLPPPSTPMALNTTTPRSILPAPVQPERSATVPTLADEWGSLCYIHLMIIVILIPLSASFLILLLNGFGRYKTEDAPAWIWGFIYNAWIELATFLFTVLWYAGTVLAEEEEARIATLCGGYWCTSPAVLIKGCLWILSLAARRSQLAALPSPPDIADGSEVAFTYQHVLFKVVQNIILGLAHISAGCDIVIGVVVLLMPLVPVISSWLSSYQEWRMTDVVTGAVPGSPRRYEPVSTDAVELSRVV